MHSSASPSPRVQVYTDGGAEPNPGVGGWGAVILDPATGKRRELSGGEPQTTNNRMELTAAIAALAALDPGAQIDVHTDSSYLRLGITQWLERWKASGWRVRGGDPVKNDDLWRALETAASRHGVRWHWVKGHSGHQHNDRAHELAAAEIRRRRSAATRRSLTGSEATPVGKAPGAGGTGHESGGATTPGSTSAARAASSSPPAADVEVLLKLICAGGRGAWAARVRRGDEECVLAGEASDVTSNRLELLAAAEVLADLPEHSNVEWRGGSDYLREGASRWLEGWRRRGYRTSSGDRVKNADLWRRLVQPLAARTLRFLPAGEEDASELAALERDLRARLRRRAGPSGA